MRVRWAVASGFDAGGVNFAAETKTGGNGAAAVMPTAATVIVSSPANVHSRMVPVFDNVVRRTPESRIEINRLSSCDGCAIDTDANDKARRLRRPRTTCTRWSA